MIEEYNLTVAPPPAWVALLNKHHNIVLERRS